MVTLKAKVMISARLKLVLISVKITVISAVRASYRQW